MAAITRTNVQTLIPDQAVRGIIKETAKQSVLLQLARRVPMSKGVAKQPVLSVLPQAGWVTGDSGRKTTSAAEWTDVVLTAEELAVIVPIPENVLDDSDYDIWGELTPEIAAEFGRLLDLAGLFGVGPTSFGTSVAELADAAGNEITFGTGVDLADDLNLAMGKVEADGFIPNGFVAPITQRAAVRGLRDDNGQPIFVPSLSSDMPATLYGERMAWSNNGGWSTGASDALWLTGDWSKAIVGIRQDVTVKLLTEATLTDGAGNVVISLAEQDMVALRCKFRVAFATANPITRLNGTAATRSPFAAVVPA